MIFERRINYYETDGMQIVHHSNYLRFLEEGRCKYMDMMGVPYNEFEKNGILIPVLSAEMEFKLPARYDDIIEIEMSISEFTGVRMNVEYEIKLKGSDRIILKAKTCHCFTDKNLKPISLKKLNKKFYDALDLEAKKK